MRRVAVLVSVALAVAVVVPAMASAKSKPKSPKAVVLTTDQLNSAALALTDMPTGYAAMPTDASAVAPNATSGICNGPNEAARAQVQGSTATAGSFFGANTTVGPFVFESLYTFPSAKRAQAFLEAGKAQGACGSYNATTSSGAQTRAIAPISFRKIGDDVFAYRLTIEGSTPGTQRGSYDYYTVRVGNNTFTVGQGGLTGANASEEQGFISTAMSKLGVTLAAAKKAANATTTTVKKK